MHSKEIAIYIHWPFCLSLCPYCDFNSHVESKIEHKEWALSYTKELEYFLPYIKNKKITSVFFGGGTPSLMNPSTISTILDFLSKNAILTAETEITLEANPTSVESKKFIDFKHAGINRLSLGIQSFIEKDLKLLGRKHSADEAIEAIDIVSNCFENYSFDLIYARPNQTLDSWIKELKFASQFSAIHVSLYQLTIEKGTPFFKLFKDGTLTLPDNEVSADMYIHTNEIMESKGFSRYEISNYAKPGFECIHNLNYWLYNNYLGIGPGAHSRVDGKAIMMLHSPKKWMEQVDRLSNGVQKETNLSESDIINEIVMMGLRLKRGISRKEFFKKVGKNFEDCCDQNYLNMLIQKELMGRSNDFYFLTDIGMNLHNYILSRLLP